MLFCRCECVTKPCNLCFAGSLATKLTNFNFIVEWISEVTLGPFLVFFCYDLGTKLGAVLPLRMRHKAMQLVLGRLAGNKVKSLNFIKVSIKVSILFQFYSRVSEVTLGLFLVFFGYVLGTKLDAVSLLRMRHNAMQLVLGRFAGHKTEKFQIYGFQKWRLGFFCYVLGAKLGAVLPLRMRHKGMQLVLGRCAGHKTERSQFYRSLKLKSQLCLAGSLATKLKSLNQFL